MDDTFNTSDEGALKGEEPILNFYSKSSFEYFDNSNTLVP
jgi:hypothetical protein